LGLEHLLVAGHNEGEGPRSNGQLVSTELDTVGRNLIGTGARLHLLRLRRVGIPTVTIEGDIALGPSFAFIIELIDIAVVVLLVPVAVDILVVGAFRALSVLSHESADLFVVISDSRAVRKRTPQINLQAPNAFLTGTEREGQVRAVAADVD